MDSLGEVFSSNLKERNKLECVELVFPVFASDGWQKGVNFPVKLNFLLNKVQELLLVWFIHLLQFLPWCCLLPSTFGFECFSYSLLVLYPSSFYHRWICRSNLFSKKSPIHVFLKLPQGFWLIYQWNITLSRVFIFTRWFILLFDQARNCQLCQCKNHPTLQCKFVLFAFLNVLTT